MDTNKETGLKPNGISFIESGLDEFTPETDFGKELWALRQKAVAEGMTLLTGEEISEEISTARNR